MKLSKRLKWTMVVAVLSLACSIETKAKIDIAPEMYVFGFSASFNDSIVYFTEMQQLDSAWIDTKTEFLMGRDVYSIQLRNFMRDDMKMPYRTCIIVFALKKKDADKKYEKLKKLYTSKPKKGTNNYDVRYLNLNEFSFSAVDMSYLIENYDEQQKAKKDEQKKRKGQQKPNGMPPSGGPGGGMGGPGGGGPGGGPGGGF